MCLGKMIENMWKVVSLPLEDFFFIIVIDL